MSKVRNYMELKLRQSFQLSEVINKSEPLQTYIHTMQMNLQLIVTLVEGYIHRLENRNTCLPIYRR